MSPYRSLPRHHLLYPQSLPNATLPPQSLQSKILLFHSPSSSVMEVEKMKRKKRVIREQEEEGIVNKKPKEGEEEATEEEVEEFFAILRRMKVAVKYFDERGRRGGKEWREALETADLTEDHGQDVAAGKAEDHKSKKKSGEVIINDGFDLNALAPEAAEGGGA
ncbi:hypothetical protein RJT34_27001 [Clitoria ternatea]|uniref:Uncharacterized protein n=1 Tax=Clitoria ternatea TaxID=43366 RepID=A0AAN9FCG3_CLITE